MCVSISICTQVHETGPGCGGQCALRLPVLPQAMTRLLGELAQTQGLLPEGSLDDSALLVWVWAFVEMEQKEDYNRRDASEVALRARQQLLAHFIHQSRYFPAACQGFFSSTSYCLISTTILAVHFLAPLHHPVPSSLQLLV